MPAPRYVGIRTERHAPLVMAIEPSDAPLAPGEIVLAETLEGQILAQVNVSPGKILFVPPGTTVARIVAVGEKSPEVDAALAARDAAALVEARNIAGVALTIDSAAWSADWARLTLSVAGQPPPDLTEIQERLAAALKAQIRLVFPGPTTESLPS